MADYELKRKEIVDRIKDGGIKLLYEFPTQNVLCNNGVWINE